MAGSEAQAAWPAATVPPQDRLFQTICQPETLRQAWETVRRKGAGGGIDGMSVAAFARQADVYLADLAAALRSGRYSPEPAARVQVPKFNDAGEWRSLSLPTVQDKIVQTAVKHVLEPLFEKRFLDCSYAYRPGKGPRRALNRVSHYLVNGKKTWVVFGDLDNFFDTLNHERLLQEVRQIVDDGRILELLAGWLKTGAVDVRGRFHDMDLGISQGGVISPLLSNIYAHPLDVHLTDRGYAYVRYADNFVALSDSAGQAGEILGVITGFLEDRLGLRLNPEKEPIRSLDQGFVFLGVLFKGRDRFLAEAKLEKLRRRLDWLTHTRRRHPLPQIIRDLAEAITGVRRYYGFLEPWGQLRSLDRHLASRLKVLLQARRQRGELKTKSETLELLKDLPCLATDHPEELARFRRDLNTQIFRSPPAGAPRPSQGQPPPPPPVASPPLPGPPSAPPTTSPPGEPPAPVQPEAHETGILKEASRRAARKKQTYVRRHHLETEIMVETPGSALRVRDQRLVLFKNKEKIYDRPLLKVKSILIQSRGVTLSSDLIEAAVKGDIPLVFSAPGGEAYALVHAPRQVKPDLGLRQLRILADGSAIKWAKLLALAKLNNQWNLLKFYQRAPSRRDSAYGRRLTEVEPLWLELERDLDLLPEDGDPKRGQELMFSMEGRVANLYWECVRLLLPGSVAFPGRVRRGAQDVVNAALNYGYAILYPRVARALLLAGFHLGLSFLHTPRPDKPTLAFDVIEPFRAPVVDRAVFSLFTREVKLALTTEKRLSAATAKKVATAVLGRLGTLVPYRGRTITLEEVIREQARLLAQSLQGQARFKPFVGRY